MKSTATGTCGWTGIYALHEQVGGIFLRFLESPNERAPSWLPIDALESVLAKIAK
jgi:hypothetical protein